MSDDQNASVPGAAGSVSVNPKASIHLTPAQYYTRLVGAFVVGAAVGVGVAYALQAALLSEEPPIRVRPGSIELHLTGGKKWQAKTGYWQIKDGEKTAPEYDLVITAKPTAANCKLQSNPKAFTITDSENDWFKIAIDKQEKRTKVTAKDPGKVTLSSDKRILSISTGSYIKEFVDVTDPQNPSSICQLLINEFVEAGVY